MISAGEIERIELPRKKDFFNFFVSKSKPVIFEGAINDWPALQCWTPEYFQSGLGEVEVFVQMKEELTGEKSKKVNTIYKKIKLSRFIDTLLSDPDNCGYLEQYPIFMQIPKLASQIRFPQLFWNHWFTWPGLFIGPKSTKSKLHLDTLDNFFAQIFGTKRIVLISPQYSKSCYPVNSYWDDTYSPIDVENPDYHAYPKFREVAYFEIILRPGDLLYIPRYWWHDVKSLEISINVNLWWCTPASALKYGHHILWEHLTRTWYPYPVKRSMNVELG